MDPKVAHLVGETALIAALVCLLVGGTLVVAGYPVEAPLLALGAVALLLVGAGASLKKRAGPR